MSPLTPAARLLRVFLFACVAAGCGAVAGLRAADARPVVGPGASRDDAIKAYGWPSGQTQTGSREILIYPQGRIFLEKGRVERVDFSPTMAWPAPRPRPPGPKTTSAKPAAVDAPVDFWLTDWVEAQTEAARRHARIMILFTGLDWSPASRQFHDEVAFEPDFVNAFTGDFVFLRLDFPSRTAQAPALKEQNAMLRERYGVTTYPSLLLVSASGVLQGRVDLEAPRAGDSYRARVIAAVREMRDAVMTRPPPVDPATKVAVAPGETPPPPGAGRSGLTQLSASLSSAGWLLVTSLAGGLVFVVLTLLWLWRRGPAAQVVSAAPVAAEPAVPAVVSLANSREWSKHQLCQVIARLAEAEGHRVAPLPTGSDADLTLTRPGETRPRALVLCLPASAGVVSPRRLREFYAAMTLEGVDEGWVIGIAGFGAEARTFAQQKNLEMIDAPALADRFDALPPLARRRLSGGEG